MIKLETFVKLARHQAKNIGWEGSRPLISATSRSSAKSSGPWGQLGADHEPKGVMSGVSSESGMTYDSPFKHP
jgi:hypothetical protein